MSKYIDADAFIQKMQRVLDENNDTSVADAISREAYEIIIEGLKKTPAADVEEVKHGEWVEDFMIGEGVYRCTNCDDKFVTLEGTPYDNRLFHCPFCGAKMDGKEKTDG